MGSIENEEKEMKQKRTKISKELKNAYQSKLQTNTNLQRFKRNADIIIQQNKEDIPQLKAMHEIYTNFNVSIPSTPLNLGTVNSLSEFAESYSRNSDYLSKETEKIGTISDQLSGYAIASGSTIGVMRSITNYLSENINNREVIKAPLETLETPSSQDRKKELVMKLQTINRELSTNLEGCWQTLQDDANKDRFRQAANSARELISHFLQELSPDKEVERADWFKPETENEKPTQRQRARYAILGVNKVLTDEELRPIYEVENNIRDSYKKLSKITHSRDYRSTQDYVEYIIDQSQIYLLKILELRKRYFQSPDKVKKEKRGWVL